jgi:hypothetical protein
MEVLCDRLGRIHRTIIYRFKAKILHLQSERNDKDACIEVDM